MLRMEDASRSLQRKHVGGNGSITLPSKAIVVAVQVSLTSFNSLIYGLFAMEVVRDNCIISSKLRNKFILEKTYD